MLSSYSTYTLLAYTHFMELRRHCSIAHLDNEVWTHESSSRTVLAMTNSESGLEPNATGTSPLSRTKLRREDIKELKLPGKVSGNR